jgi:hypothetical protein
MCVGRHGLGAESNISDVGSVSIDNQSKISLLSLSRLVEKSTAQSAKEKLMATIHTESFD